MIFVPVADVLQLTAVHMQGVIGGIHLPPLASGLAAPAPTPLPGANAPAAPAPTGGSQLEDLYNLLSTVRTAIFYIGITVFLIGVTVAGIMRVSSFGSERRIATSNMALTAAIAGLLIMLMAQGVYSFIYGAFFK